MKINQISPLESDFTEVLSTIALKPKILYYYGKMPENVPFLDAPGGIPYKKKRMRPKTVAIVGSRKNTPYGEEIAYRTAYELARLGVVVVSGLAYGIDSIAHRGALDGGGTTIAVLGTPIDKIYPSAHKPLAREIVEKGGAVMSEYPPISPGLVAGVSVGASPGDFEFASVVDEEIAKSAKKLTPTEVGKARFLYRNRLISGLADVTLVVEAAERSGSLNTASHALEQGRELFAVPGGVGAIFSEGCNNLIAAGARVFRKTDDILEALFPAYTPSTRASKRRVAGAFTGSEAEKAIIEQIGKGVIEGEEIMRRSGIDAATYNQAISLLEIKGVVKGLGANRWMLR